MHSITISNLYFHVMLKNNDTFKFILPNTIVVSKREGRSGETSQFFCKRKTGRPQPVTTKSRTESVVDTRGSCNKLALWLRNALKSQGDLKQIISIVQNYKKSIIMYVVQRYDTVTYTVTYRHAMNQYNKLT